MTACYFEIRPLRPTLAGLLLAFTFFSFSLQSGAQSNSLQSGAQSKPLPSGVQSNSLQRRAQSSAQPDVSAKWSAAPGGGSCIVLAEQAEKRIVIANVDRGKIIWEWSAQSGGLPATAVNWFTNPSDVKVVYGGQYLLTTASGGGVALIRISDRKTMFYAYAGGNPHSAELLPDGNIVVASSTGNYLTVFKTDTLSATLKTAALGGTAAYSKRIPVAFGHNVVWDRKGQLLWTAAMNQLIAYRYNGDCAHPDLKAVDSFPLPGTEAHDLFPVYGSNVLWLTNTTNVYLFDLATHKLTQASTPQKNIKSISSGPKGYPVIMVTPKEKWWTDEIRDSNGKQVFYQGGLKIYKARWFLPNLFSYREDDLFKQCISNN